MLVSGPRVLILRKRLKRKGRRRILEDLKRTTTEIPDIDDGTIVSSRALMDRSWVVQIHAISQRAIVELVEFIVELRVNGYRANVLLSAKRYHRRDALDAG